MKYKILQVELAFRKFDLDRDGFLSWDEFRQVFTIMFTWESLPVKETLPKALRTQALTALTSNFGLVGLVRWVWLGRFWFGRFGLVGLVW